MNKENLIQLMENYLNGDMDQPNFEPTSDMDSLQAYYCRTAIRLKEAFQLQKEDPMYWNDFLMALRDFLLTFATGISLKMNIPEDNDYAIKKDETTGLYYANFQFPEGVDSDLAEQAYMRNEAKSEKHGESHNLMTDSLIYALTGFRHFKSMAQKLAVYGALNTPYGYTTLISLPTGGGKSLITQMLAYQSEGLTVVVVPTVSLADDQLIAAKQIIKSDNIDQEILAYRGGDPLYPILDAIQKRTARLLFISPEALMNNPKIEEAIKNSNKLRYLKNIVIDEAHIVIDWGASFRVDYQCLESWRKRMMLSNPTIRTILLSATFENKCVDVLKNLFSDGKHWIEIRCDALRHEPRYLVLKEKNFELKDKKTVELVRKLPHPMIIYVARPDDAERVRSILSDKGIKNVRTYTGLTGRSQREQLLKNWKANKFEIMIATSAFGVGVDKPDVRTVLHLYIPQNPNTYYQELGRGGRDQLPCLSVLCTYPNDINNTFNRINKRVMTVDKIIGRWDSMYNNKNSRREAEKIEIDTSIKPNYHAVDEWDDSPVSDADMNWNIYVLLLFRRYGLIDIHEIIKSGKSYIFLIEIKDDLLLMKGAEQTRKIEQIRTEEWNYYDEAYSIMKESLQNNPYECWSEMFFKTYDKVYEYCAGCSAHKTINNEDTRAFALKQIVKEPVKTVDLEQKSMFEMQDELVIRAKDQEKIDVIRYLERKRLSCLVATEEQLDNIHYFELISSKKVTFILEPKEVKELLKNQNYFYVSGVVAILYPHTQKEIINTYKIATQYLCHKKDIHVIHILSEDIYIPSRGKYITDLIEGRIISAESLCHAKEGRENV